MDILSLNKQMAGGGAGVKIHVIDTGCALVGALRGVVEIVPFRGEAVGNQSSASLTPGQPSKVNYEPTREHGTLMCSIAHRQAPEAEILSYNAIPDSTSYYINEALAYILSTVKTDTAHRHVVTMSLMCSGDADSSTFVTMHELIRQLVDLEVPVVVAAGNDGRRELNLYPSCFSEPVTVSAVNADGTPAKFSVWHNEVDFCECGVNVPCIGMDGSETTCDGTSPATQTVGGKIAQLLGKNPKLSEAELYTALKANVTDLGDSGYDEHCGWGWIASTAAPEASTGTTAENTESSNNSQRILKLTKPLMRGADVYALELALEALEYDCGMTAREKLTKIGAFGEKCDAAVRAFQRAAGLVVDGKAGNKTRAALAAGASPITGSVIPALLSWVSGRVGDIYTWGAQGENLTAMSKPEAWIKKMETSTTNANRAIAFYQKTVATGRSPILAFDCSGLIVKFLMDKGLTETDLSSRGLYRLCTKIKRDELTAGCLLFRKNALGIVKHVGLYIGDGLTIEAKGRDDGVVKRNINAGGTSYWTDYGKLPCLK